MISRASRASDPASPPGPSAAAREPLRVLLLEDDEGDAALEVRALETSGFAVVYARVDSEPAFTAALAQGRYDVVLSDYNLPGFDGLRALDALRAQRIDVPFILVSGALGEEKAIESLKLGATDYVLKGRLERLAPVVRRALRDADDRRRRTWAEAANRTLVDVARDLTGTFDFRAVLPGIAVRTAAAVQCDAVTIFCCDGERPGYRLLGQHGLAPALLEAARQLVFGPTEPFAGRLLDGTPICIDDVFEDASQPALYLRPFGFHSVVVMPLRSHDRHFGSMSLANRERRPFSADQIDLCEAIAHQVAGALEVAEFQRALQDDAQVATALARVGQELISSVDLPVLLDRLCQVTTEVLAADVSYTMMLCEDEQVLRAVAASGESPERWETIRALDIPIIGGMMRQLRESGLVRFTDAIAESIPPALTAAYDLRRAVSVPLLRGEHVIGVQVAGRRSAAEFTVHQERIAAGIAQLASFALENARLVGALAAANRLKSDFLATMSHELRTPLNVILGYNELLMDEVFGALTPEQTASLDRVGTSARELLELINATLDISRLETGRAALNLQDIEPATLLHDIEVETRALREKPGVESVWVLAPDLPRLYSDVVKLKVLLKNLIANAVKFTDRGSVTISAAARDGWIEFAVKDTGIGMSRETQAVIFEPFRQGDSSPTRRHGGVGLGLYIVSRLLELLSGRIEVESAPGAGSTFRVWIPIDAMRYARLARDQAER